eukprot:CAMPEP_0172527748 /NCGR_PEP_ID=MMETSP1067-20121228/2350_1 /TAXON_ID=265564 ORGANISM="Thalassiosira punctigera, Strain Tpunct2005C2" /NCGR_SAMPLE_ID=MMETSP1067 /ASSEMBLY_ACC=CAM_ASM_000444 /LENGTH=293 /DNA_ID=CAMNT_0013311545 /DNA_START=213 /DNA_END=1094 /DNA_ORIENTATION=+
MSDLADIDIEPSQAAPGGTSPEVNPRIQTVPTNVSTKIAAGFSRLMDASKDFIYVEVASLFLWLACVADWYDTIWYKYALSVAGVSLMVCMLLQAAEYIVPGTLVLTVTGGHSLEKLCSMFMLLWWACGTGIMTFHAPFVVTSNGWIAAWGGLLASVKWYMGLKSSIYHDQPEGFKQLFHLVICSVILIFASIPPIIQKWEHHEGAGLSIAGAVITLIPCVLMLIMYSEVSKNVMKIMGLSLFALWASIAGVCTFHGPFLVTNNGYISSWLGCVCSLHLMMLQMKDASPENYM